MATWLDLGNFFLNRPWNCFNLSQECQPPEVSASGGNFQILRSSIFRKKKTAPRISHAPKLFWNCSLRSSSSMKIFGSPSERTADELLWIDFIDLGFHRTQLWDFGIIIPWSSRLDTVLQLVSWRELLSNRRFCWKFNGNETHCVNFPVETESSKL